MTTAHSFIGLSKHRAQDLAEKQNLVFRLVSVDGEEMLGWPEDQRQDRVCCVVEDGRVTGATVQ